MPRFDVRHTNMRHSVNPVSLNQLEFCRKELAPRASLKVQDALRREQLRERHLADGGWTHG